MTLREFGEFIGILLALFAGPALAYHLLLWAVPAAAAPLELALTYLLAGVVLAMLAVGAGAALGLLWLACWAVWRVLARSLYSMSLLWRAQ
jgi:hypothetical protein